MAPHHWLIITLAFGLLVGLPAAKAQQQGKIPLVGVLEPSAPTGPRRCSDSFQQGLRDLGYMEGQTIAFEYRYAEGQHDRLPALAAELVRLTPDVIWTHSNAAALAAKQAITTIPVVVGVSQDLVELGVVESLAQPGGNLTGLDLGVFELMGKRLELMNYPAASCEVSNSRLRTAMARQFGGVEAHVSCVWPACASKQTSLSTASTSASKMTRRYFAGHIIW